MQKTKPTLMKLIDSDYFLDMPLSSQALYFHLVMRADSDGVIDNIKSIQRGTNANKGDLELLFDKKLITYVVGKSLVFVGATLELV